MKIINLGRGQGKTTRLLYASEFNDMPILCANDCMKKDLLAHAMDYGLKIPEPLSVSEIVNGYIKEGTIVNNDILVDEAPLVLQNLLSYLGVRGGVRAITLTEEQMR